jgi:hypothetical protein
MRERERWTGPCLAVLFLWIGLPPGDAFAQEPEADPAAAQFFRAGLAAYERHEYRAAALAFEEADRRAPRAAAMYNAARAWQAGGDSARAADAFAAALGGPNLGADETASANKGLLLLEPSLGKVVVTGPSSASLFFDETERGAIPKTVHASPGAHDVRVRRKDGSDVTRHLIVIAGQTESIAVPDLASLAPPTTVAEPKTPSSASTDKVDGADKTLFRPWGYVAFGGTAALAIAGGLTYFGFTEERSSFDATNDHDSSLHASAEAYRAATYVLWSVGAACGVVGVVLAFVPRARDTRSATVVLGPGVVSLGGSF